MPTLEVFFDHTCPYCYRGHAMLKELLPLYPNAQIKWIPIEAHPRHEEPDHLPYEDLAVQGAFFVREQDGDEVAYHERIYKAHFEDKVPVDDVAVLKECIVELGLDGEAFAQAILNKTYEKAQLASNDYAYEEKDVWAVPTFVCGEHRLDAEERVGVTKEQIKALLDVLYSA
ncbi:MAG: DsbA family oxidoreductase [Christensenellaceae bacterium]